MIQKAAARNYGPALYEVAHGRIDRNGLPQDVDQGMKEMRAAATLGSLQAPFQLGNRHAKGDGVPRELDRARRYYRLCATQGVACASTSSGGSCTMRRRARSVTICKPSLASTCCRAGTGRGEAAGLSGSSEIDARTKRLGGNAQTPDRPKVSRAG